MDKDELKENKDKSKPAYFCLYFLLIHPYPYCLYGKKKYNF